MSVLTGRICWCGHDEYYHQPDRCRGWGRRAPHEVEPDWMMGAVWPCPCEMPAYEKPVDA